MSHDSPPVLRHPGRYLRDPDVRRAAVVCLVALLASFGLVWLGYLLWAWRVAARAPVEPAGPGVLLVFGQQLVDDRPAADYRARLTRAWTLMHAGLAPRVLLLGGRSGGRRSEAEVGRDWLLDHGVPHGVRMELEQQSIDSLENLRHARDLLRADAPTGPLPPVALLTSRYHLARCRLLARRLGFRTRLVAAEDALHWNRRVLTRLLMEATYLMWIDLGVRWAEWTGNRRMADRIR